MEGHEQEEAPPIADRLRQVEEAVRKVGSGEWTWRQFEAAVRVWLEAVEEQERRLGSFTVPESLENELALGLDGARLFRLGLGRMLCFTEDRNPQHLSEGLDQVRQGHGRLNQALHLNPRAAEILGRLRPPWND